MKISKASWMILAAGVFIIVLAGLGMTRSGQISEYDSVSSNLSLLTTRLNNMPAASSQAEIDEYKQQLKDTQEQIAEVKQKLIQSVISVDVSDKFYEIADYCEVTVTNLNTTRISSEQFSAIDCDMISVSASIRGDTQNIVDFVTALNDNFSTGFVRAAQFSFEGETGTLGVQMTVYTRKGN